MHGEWRGRGGGSEGGGWCCARVVLVQRQLDSPLTVVGLSARRCRELIVTSGCAVCASARVEVRVCVCACGVGEGVIV